MSFQNKSEKITTQRKTGFVCFMIEKKNLLRYYCLFISFWPLILLKKKKSIFKSQKDLKFSTLPNDYLKAVSAMYTWRASETGPAFLEIWIMPSNIYENTCD